MWFSLNVLHLPSPANEMNYFIPCRSGSHVTGTVTNVTDFGVFVDLGGVEGLIHISELSWGRVSHPNQIVKLGEEIKVQVLEISVERCRVALSLKRLIPNPWEHAQTSFAVGNVVVGCDHQCPVLWRLRAPECRCGRFDPRV